MLYVSKHDIFASPIRILTDLQRSHQIKHFSPKSSTSDFAIHVNSMQPLLKKQTAMSINTMLKKADAGIPIHYESDEYTFSDQLKELQILNVHESDSSDDVNEDAMHSNHHHQIINQTLTNYSMNMNDHDKVRSIKPQPIHFYTHCTNKLNLSPSPFIFT